MCSTSKNKLYSEDSKERIFTLDALPDLREKLTKEGKALVTLNGSFDLLHAGHLQIIFEASQQGDFLLVGLNSDSSIKQYKSKDRPIIPLKYRLEMMSSLRFVDGVTFFNETDPLHFLELAKPDVHVNGPEYGEECLEAQLVKKQGGRIHIAQFVPGLSTSNVIQKIGDLCAK